MTDLTVITPPEGEPVSLSQAKDYLRVAHDGEDDLINDLVKRATARVEQASTLALVDRRLKLCWSEWPLGLTGRGARLSPGPVKALAAVRIVDDQDIATDQTARFHLTCGRLCLRPWSIAPGAPSGGHIEIEFDTGFGTAEAVPKDLQGAVLRLVGYGYASRTPGTFDFPSEEGRLPPDVQGILTARRELRL
ncbi:MAG: head-tail connector protein [Henriciella sp.]|nr:head-tail connector protein [Henriciella sp.]